MSAELKPVYEKNRVPLAEKIPLDTPFTFYIASSHICNFRSDYCTQSWCKADKNKISFKEQFIDYDLFLKTANQLKEFPQKVKQILFTGLGEPLMNPRTPDMVKVLHDLNVGEKIEMWTNASFLTHEMSDRLVDAGLTRLRISIQGVTAQDYKKTSNVEIDFDEMVSNIRYFYEHKGNCTVYIKIIDSCLHGEDDRKRFFDTFSEICDEIYVEHLVTIQPTMGDYDGRVDETLNLYGEKSVDKDICPLAFYVLQIDAVGNIFPCTPLGLPESFSIGNVEKTSLVEAWHGEKLKKLRIALLQKRRTEVSICNTCICYSNITQKEDNLDSSADELIERIMKQE